jgi:hypothetical protein
MIRSEPRRVRVAEGTMRPFPLLVFAAIVAACASDPAAPRTYWHKPGGSNTDFSMANQHCGAAASRATPTPRADQLESGVVAPNNAPDRPPRPWVSAVAEKAYYDCMAKEGWSVTPR